MFNLKQYQHSARVKAPMFNFKISATLDYLELMEMINETKEGANELIETIYVKREEDYEVRQFYHVKLFTEYLLDLITIMPIKSNNSVELHNTEPISLAVKWKSFEIERSTTSEYEVDVTLKGFARGVCQTTVATLSNYIECSADLQVIFDNAQQEFDFTEDTEKVKASYPKSNAKSKTKSKTKSKKKSALKRNSTTKNKSGKNKK